MPGRTFPIRSARAIARGLGDWTDRAGGSRQEAEGSAGLTPISAVKCQGPLDHSTLPAPYGTEW